MNRLFPLLLLLAGVCQAQTTIHFYTVPFKNAYNVQARDLGNDEFMLLFDTYCYTPGSVVIEGCPRGYYLYRLDAGHDTLWTRHLQLDYPDFRALLPDETQGKIKVFGALSPESGTCNDETIWATNFSGISRPTVHNFDLAGEYLDSAKFTVDDCFLEYRFARRLPGNRTLFGAQYFERGSQGPLGYAEARYFVLNAQDETEQSFVYPDKYYFNTKWTEVDDTTTLIVHYNVKSQQHEFVKIDQQGNELWAKPYQGPPVVVIRNIQILKNGDIATLGVYYDNQVRKNLLNRYDPNANLLWSKEFNNSNATTALGELDNGQLIYGESMWNGASSQDIMLRVLSPDGDSIHAKWYPLSPGIDQIGSILAKGNAFYFTGDAYSGLDSTFGPSRPFLAFEDAILTNTKEQISDAGSPFTIVPNPAANTIQIRNLSTAQIEFIELYDRTGRKIRNITADFDRINISDLEKGLYLLQVCDAEKKSDILKFLKL